MFWTEIKKAINSTLGTAGFQPLDQMLGGMIEANAPIPTIKNIQRGYSKGSTTEHSISFKTAINPDKAMVILAPTMVGAQSNGNIYTPALKLLESTQMTITQSCYYAGSSYATAGYSWQVIEFN